MRYILPNRLFLILPVLCVLCFCSKPSEKVLYEELTPQNFRDRIAAAPIAYLPLGTIEWHGEHLPLGADGLQSKAFFEILAHEVGGIVFPMLFLGPDRQQMVDNKELYGMDICFSKPEGKHYYPTQQLDGSCYWIPDSTFKIIMEAALKQIKRAGFKIVVAHGHGPSTGFTEKHTQEWQDKFGLKIFHCWGNRDKQGLGIMVDHAAMNETSLLMAFRPELVHMENLPADTTIWPVGLGGKDPRIYASKKFGEKAIRIQKERMAAILGDELKKL